MKRLIMFSASAVAFGLAGSAAFAAAGKVAEQSAPPAAQPMTRAALVSTVDGNFKAIDTNGDGSLSAAELAAAEGKIQQQRIGVIRQRIEAEFTKLDTNKDGQLSKAEFMAAAPTSASAAPNGPALVSRLDSNKDGKVSAEEYRAPVLQGFDRVDTNHDGTISPTERAAAAKAARTQ